MRSNQNVCWLGVVANVEGSALDKPRNDASARFGLNPEGMGFMARMALLQVAYLD